MACAFAIDFLSFVCLTVCRENSNHHHKPDCSSNKSLKFQNMRLIGSILLSSLLFCMKHLANVRVRTHKTILFSVKVNHTQNFTNRARATSLIPAAQLLKHLVRSYSLKLTAKTPTASRHLQIL